MTRLDRGADLAEQAEHKRQHPLARLGELLDASALGVVTLLLLGASLFMTWRGMRDFIASRDMAEGAVSQGLIFVMVATLSLAMYVALREMVAPYYVRGWWSAIWKRVVAGILYAVLALWSVGFGYGFWWSLVAGQDATEAGLQRTVTSVVQETSDMRARLAAAESVMASAEDLSNRKAEQEAARGGTCGVASPAGAGPLARARSETQAQIAALSASVRQEWRLPLIARLTDLEAGLESALENGAVLEGEARKIKFEALGRETEAAAREIGADATARGRTLAAQLRAKASQLSAPPVNGRVAYCYDRDLSAGLRAAADELEQAYEISVTPFRFAEGADGVARAIEDLTRRGGAMIGVGEASAPNAMEGRDLIALLAAIGVDLALFVFGLLRGSGGRRRREGQARQALEREALATEGLAREVLAVETAHVVIEDAIEQAPAPKALAAPETAPPEDAAMEDEVQEGEYEEAGSGGLVDTYDPDSSQVDEAEQIKELLGRVQHLMQSINAATLATERTPLQNKQRDALRKLREFGYVDTGASDKYYKEGLHETVSIEASDKPAGYILEILRPRFIDADGRLLEKALVIVSSGPGGGETGY